MDSKDGAVSAPVPFTAPITSYLLTSEGYHYQIGMLSFGNCQLPALLAQSAGVLGLFGNQRRVFFATLSLSVPLALHPEVTLDRVPRERPPRREAGEEKKK